MLKYLILFIVTLVVASAIKQEYELFPVGRLRRKTVDNDFGGIAIKKQLFQDIFTEHQKGDKLQFGYVCEDPVQWEQRFEEKDFENNRHRGKIKWGNLNGNYGEHYWDLNH